MKPSDPGGTRADYPYFATIATRWMDNDVYGHVNNVVYYSFFDTAIAEFLVREGGFAFADAEIVGLAVESGCRYKRAIAYPQTVHAGVRVAHLGNSSVRYEVGIFADEEQEAAAEGHFVHVFVERRTSTPTRIPDPLRAAMERVRAS